MANPNLPAVPTYGSTDIAQFGNNVLLGLVQSLAFEEHVSELQQQSEGVKQHIGFELTRAILDMSEKDENLNIYAIFDDKKATEKLNTRLLVAMGVLERKIMDDEIVVTWTDAKVEKLYAYAAVDKEKNPEEYKRRFDNRKRLNLRLSDACKAAIALRDANTKSTDLKFEEVEGVVTPIITNAPKEIAGENKEGKVVFGSRATATGASASPTLSSLVKMATNKHKKAEGESTERSDKGNDRSGDAKIGMSDEDFGGIVNNLKRAISAQEGAFSSMMIKQMESLVTPLASAIETGKKNLEAEKAAKKNKAA